MLTILLPSSYSVDFFDEKHHVVVSSPSQALSCFFSHSYLQLGASYATIPRLADRGTVRNFYQVNLLNVSIFLMWF
jgi:hypothetical protein